MEIRPDRLNEMQFLPGSGRIDTAVWMHFLDANKTAGEEARRQLHKNIAINTEQVLGCSPEDLPEAMNGREKWREKVRDIRASGTTWWWWWWQE